MRARVAGHPRGMARPQLAGCAGHGRAFGQPGRVQAAGGRVGMPYRRRGGRTMFRSGWPCHATVMAAGVRGTVMLMAGGCGRVMVTTASFSTHGGAAVTA